MKRELPKFSSDEELAEWIETHDLSDYLDSLEVVTEEIKVQRTPREKQWVGLNLNPKYLDAIKRVAKTRGIPYKTLIQNWLIEKLGQEAPDSLPKR
ncbi:MAG TPA: CopG family antitoxin [Pyrinomonadaceae bacterium]|nr:CopG family antitoxin [Pyrinomonadaceae bacterium]